MPPQHGFPCSQIEVGGALSEWGEGFPLMSAHHKLILSPSTILKLAGVHLTGPQHLDPMFWRV